ncbi:MAG: hypothetical protein ABI693_01840 [Bryobacteraceae bacterium]
MTTKQLEANRANAKKSTGPTTAEGKKQSSRNSTRHGLTSKDVFVPAGLTQDFDALKDDLRDELQPATALQMIFFNQALANAWKQVRCERAEAELADKVSEPGTDPLTDPQLQSTLRTIERARAQANRLLNDALKNFRQAKADERNRIQPDLFADLDLGTLQNEANLLAVLTPDPLLTPEVMAAFQKLQADPKATALDYPALVEFMASFKNRAEKVEQTNPIACAAA